MVSGNLKHEAFIWRACVCLSFVLQVLALQSPVQAADEWKQVDSKAGRFSFQMPSEPKEEKDKIETEAGPTDMFTYSLEVDNGNKAYSAIYFDFPKVQVNADKLLDTVKSGMVEGTKGKLLEDKKIKLQGHSGREILIQLPGGLFYRGQMFLVGNRMYQIVVAQKSKTRSADVARFFKSVKLHDAEK